MRLFCFGYGYVAVQVAQVLQQRGWHISGTARSAEKAEQMSGFVLNDTTPLSDEGRAALHAATHVLVSIPPGENGVDAAWKYHAEEMQDKWVGYLSTTGVYGDWQGDWVDEASPTKATEPRSIRRIQAETNWQNVQATLFRLAGIYGPNRNALHDIRVGKARYIHKPGHYFSRMHVEDIVQVLLSAIKCKTRAEIFNLCDDLPTSSHEVIAYGYQLLGMQPPPLIPFEQAELSPMAHSFYAANRRVKNDKIKEALGVELTYPTYREGLASILQEEAGV